MTMQALARGRAAAEEKPEPMAPSALWAALTAVPRPSREVPLPRNLPGTDTPVGRVLVWPLTQEEQMACNTEADRFVRALMKEAVKKGEESLGYTHSFTNETAVQVLFRACRDPQDPKRPAFPSPAAMRGELTSDEVGVLFASYCTVQAELGPIRAYLTEEESEALILRLVEGGSAYPFDSLSWEAQRTLVSFLASRLASCWIAISSAGLPLDVSTLVSEWLQSRKSDDASSIPPGINDDADDDDAPTNDAPASTRVDAEEPSDP